MYLSVYQPVTQVLLCSFFGSFGLVDVIFVLEFRKERKIKTVSKSHRAYNGKLNRTRPVVELLALIPEIFRSKPDQPLSSVVVFYLEKAKVNRLYIGPLKIKQKVST